MFGKLSKNHRKTNRKNKRVNTWCSVGSVDILRRVWGRHAEGIALNRQASPLRHRKPIKNSAVMINRRLRRESWLTSTNWVTRGCFDCLFGLLKFAGRVRVWNLEPWPRKQQRPVLLEKSFFLNFLEKSFPCSKMSGINLKDTFQNRCKSLKNGTPMSLILHFF